MSAVVKSKQTPGTGTSTITLPSIPTKGNTLVAFLMQEFGPTSPPTAEDNISGATGWTTNETAALQGGSTNGLWVATKEAVGTEESITPKKGGSGPIIGICYFEVSGTLAELDLLVASSNGAGATSKSSGAVTTSNVNDVILGCVGFGATNGGSGEWSGTGPMTRVSAEATRAQGGSYIPGKALAAVTFTANWTTSRTHSMLIVAVKGAATASNTMAMLL